MNTITAPINLPDGLVVFVKRECATCEMVDPILVDIPCTVYTQDDPSFPTSMPSIHDADLSISWALQIETVPTLLRVVDGRIVERTEGWDRAEWRRISGDQHLGETLPPFRPGCGSLSVDPNIVDSLRARFEGSRLRSRRIEIGDAEDEFEAMFARGVTDGLPVVPPTPERVLRMLQGTHLLPTDTVAVVPPDLAPASVEKVAINAVMAGCLPEYLPWVIAGVRAVCTEEFNVHGVLCTTMPVGPILIANGPGTRHIEMNAESNVLGQGNRANATIGRAVQLVIRNIGGGRPGPGGTDRATHGNPGKIGWCFAEREHDSPFEPLATSRGIAAGTDAITIFAGEGPRCVVDQKARTAEQLANVLGDALLHVHTPKLAMAFDALLVLGPEHARLVRDAGWDRARFTAELLARCTRPGTDWVEGAHGIADGLPGAFAGVPELCKFRPDGLLVVHAGGDAGLFSTIIGGWAGASMGSTPVTVAVQREDSK